MRYGHRGFRLNLFSSLVVIIGMMVVIKRKIVLRFRFNELIFFIAVCAFELPIQLIAWYDYFAIGNAVKAIITFSMMVAVLMMLDLKRSGKAIWNAFNVLTVIASILVIIQHLLQLSGYSFNNSFLREYLFTYHQFDFHRPSSVYSEPSHYAEMALLSLYNYIFIKKNIPSMIVVGVGLMFSTSSLAIVGSGVLIGLFVFYLNSVKMKRSNKYIILISTIAIGLYLAYWITVTTNLIITRTLNGASSGVRVFRSFELFGLMNWYHRLVGIGIQNQALYLNWYDIVLPSDARETLINREFAQTFGYILATTGLLGLFAFYGPLSVKILNCDYRIKVLFALFLFVSLTCCIFSRQSILIYLILLYSTIDKPQLKKEHVIRFVWRKSPKRAQSDELLAD
jgi:hypothetical protein